MFFRGFSWSMVRMFFRGLVFTTARFTFLLGALSTFLIASLLRRADRSVLAILGWGRFQLFLTVRLFLSLPLPALMRLVAYTLATSAQALLRLRNTTASLVFWKAWTLSETTRGTSLMPLMT